MRINNMCDANYMSYKIVYESQITIMNYNGIVYILFINKYIILILEAGPCRT